MRFNSTSLAALSISVALGLSIAGCREDRADSTYHPSPAAWFGYDPSSVDGTHAAQSPNVTPKVLSDEAASATPGTTRETANIGGTGGGPTDGTTKPAEHAGHGSGKSAAASTADDGIKPVSRTGK